MAIRLGDVEFALGADTKALTKSVDKLKAFGTVVEKTSKSQAKGASTTAKALRRQEKAITGNLQKVLALNTNLRKSDFGAPLVKQANAAFRSYNTSLTKTKVSTLDYQRANTKLNASLGKVRRKFNELNVKNPKGGIDNLTNAFQSLGNIAVLVTGPLGGFAARMTVLTSIVKRGGFAWGLFIAGFAAGIAIIVKLSGALFRVAREMSVVRGQLEAVTGSTILAEFALREMTDIALKSGQALKTVSSSYAKFMIAAQGTAIAGDKAKKIFIGMSLAISKLQLPADNARGIFKALEQMISKNRIQAEELRNQMGDQLPGAMSIAARALKKTTKELGRMLKAGEVLADDFLPKFNDELLRTLNIDPAGTIDNLATRLNNTSTQFTLLLDTMDKSLGVSELYSSAIKNLGDNLGKLNVFFGGAKLNTKELIIETEGLIKAYREVGLVSLASMRTAANAIKLTIKAQVTSIASLRTQLAEARESSFEGVKSFLNSIGASFTTVESVAGQITVKTKEMNAQMKLLNEVLAIIDDETKKLKVTIDTENAAKATDALQSSVVNSMGRIGDAIGDMVARGRLDLESFASVTQSIVADILKTLLRLAVVNRLKNFLFNLSGSAAFPVLGGAKVAAAAKGAVVGGPVTKMAKGGLISQPTMFNTAGGNVLAGEAGTEAILPLKRDSSGRLGVSGGGGRPVNITVNISTPSPDAFRSSEGQISGALRRAVAAGNRSM